MNVSHTKHYYLKTVVLLALLISLLPRTGECQTYKPFSTLTGTQVSDTIMFNGLAAFIPTALEAKHGTTNVQSLPGGRIIKYTPNPGFVGLDTFAVLLQFGNTFPYSTYQAYKISVFPSWLSTQADFAVANASGSATISVLANDGTSAPPLTLSTIPVCSNGTASIQPNGQIVFTAQSGFNGIAHLNYVVCDAADNCRTENVDISVPSNTAPGTDTLQYATAKNTQLNMPLAFSGYNLLTPPARGSLAMPNPHSFIYKPFKDSVGVDEFVLRNVHNQDTTYTLVKINVLNTPAPNKIALDDYVFTPTNKSVEFNVRENDVNGTLTGNTISVKSFQSIPAAVGVLEHPISNTNGKFRFTPAPNFTGVATFKYFVGNQNVPNLENATVSIFVNNLAPSAATFKLNTPKATPIIVNYKLPFLGFDFSILDQPNNGNAVVHLGFQTITVNGQTISGYNLLVYTPDANYVGADEMEIQYCIQNGQCYTVKIEVDVLNMNGTFCVDDCVWTGDANYDGVVNHRDLLPIGFFMGLGGAVRPNAALEWYGQFADNWTTPFANFPTNLKHSDADGNGYIGLADTAALHRFYGKTHNLFPEIPPKFKGDNGVTTGLKLLSHALGQPIEVGDQVEIEVSLGTAAKPIANLYGYVYKYQFNSNWVISDLNMEFYSNAWMSLNSPTIGFARSNLPTNTLETAFTRTNGLPQSGWGKVAKVDFIVVDVIEGGKPGDAKQLSLTATGGEGMDNNGQEVALPDATINLLVKIPGNSTDDNEQVQENQLFVFPNPTSDLAIFHLNGNNEINELRIFSTTGTEVWNSGKVNWKRAEISVADLPNGMYFAVANTTGGRVTKKFQVIR